MNWNTIAVVAMIYYFCKFLWYSGLTVVYVVIAGVKTVARRGK